MALRAGAFFLVTAPALSYAPEGRAYVLAMAASLNAAFLAASCLAGGPAERRHIIVAALVATVCTWLHVYGALFCGSLGAALILVGLFAVDRGDIVRLGFAFSLSAVAAFAAWIAVAFPMFAKTAATGFWILFTRDEVIGALWTIKAYALGFNSAGIAGAVLIGASLLRPASRPMALVAAITGSLFILLPFVVSLHTVIFLGRYFLVGMPALFVLTMFVVRAHMLALAGEARPGYHHGLALLGMLFLLAPVITGAFTASWHFKTRWDWRGIDVVEPLIGQCPEGQVRVLNTTLWYPGFGYLLRGRLGYVNAADAPVRDVADINCPVYGWAEHYRSKDDPLWALSVTVPEALAEFRLTNVRGLPLVLDRHYGGFVLRRAEARP
jgi:hypothetical protein